MQITLGQQYNNVGEKPTVILYIYINRHAKTLKTNQRQCSPPSHMVVTHQSHISSSIHYYKGYKYKATTWYLNGFPTGSNLCSLVLFWCPYIMC